MGFIEVGRAPVQARRGFTAVGVAGDIPLGVMDFDLTVDPEYLTDEELDVLDNFLSFEEAEANAYGGRVNRLNPMLASENFGPGFALDSYGYGGR